MSFQIPAARSDAGCFASPGICGLPPVLSGGVPDRDKLLIPPLRNGSGSGLRKYDVHGEFCVYDDLHSARCRDNKYDSYLARCLVYGVFSSFLLVFSGITALSVP